MVMLFAAYERLMKTTCVALLGDCRNAPCREPSSLSGFRLFAVYPIDARLDWRRPWRHLVGPWSRYL